MLKMWAFPNRSSEMSSQSSNMKGHISHTKPSVCLICLRLRSHPEVRGQRSGTGLRLLGAGQNKAHTVNYKPSPFSMWTCDWSVMCFFCLDLVVCVVKGDRRHLGHATNVPGWIQTPDMSLISLTRTQYVVISTSMKAKTGPINNKQKDPELYASLIIDGEIIFSGQWGGFLLLFWVYDRLTFWR